MSVVGDAFVVSVDSGVKVVSVSSDEVGGSGDRCCSVYGAAGYGSVGKSEAGSYGV